MSVKTRQYVERQIVTAAIKAAIKAGYFISVNDGEETTLIDSLDEKIILTAMFTTDEDYLFVRKEARGADKSAKTSDTEDFDGWMRFIYGNDGYDVLSDYTTNLEHIMPAVNTEIAKWD